MLSFSKKGCIIHYPSSRRYFNVISVIAEGG
jgi:hypothetical protein